MLDAQSIKSSEGGQARGLDVGKKTTGRKRRLITGPPELRARMADAAARTAALYR